MKIRRPCVLSFVVCIVAFAIVSEGAEREAILKSIIGNVKVRKGQSPIWKDGKQQMALHEKDAVRTMVESQAEIMTTEGSVMKLDENTTLEVSTMKDFGGAQSTKVKVLSGTILANVKKLVGAGSSFEFETPTAVASIRGTTLGIDVSGDKTSIKVYEGEVQVKPRGAAAGVSVSTNQMVTVTKGQKTITPEAISEKDKNAVMGKIASDTTHKDTVKTTPADTSAKAKAGAAADTTRKAPAADTTAKQKTSADTSAKGSLKVNPADTVSAQLRLTVTSPPDNSHVKPGTQIAVQGKVSPASAKVSVGGATATVSATGDFKALITAGQAAGDFEISIDASSGSQSQSAVRKYTVDAPAVLILQITSPTDGQKFGQTIIPVSGTTTPGADVSVSGIKCQVGPNGAFSGRIPIPDEENQVNLEFEASLGSQSQSAVKKIVYQPDLTMVITNPPNGQLVNSTSVQVSGQVLPSTAELLVYDTKIPISTNGNFLGTIAIPDQEGQVTINFDVTYQGASKTDSRTITYKKSVDKIAPLIQPTGLPTTSTSPSISFTVFDQTPDDELTFYKLTDGSRESDVGKPNSNFILTLSEGMHNYTVYAEDLAHNRSTQVTGTVTYLTRGFLINMRKPLGTDVVRIPPPSPASVQAAPVYTVQFTILNVPNDDRRLIKEVSVTNLATHKTVTQRNITDLDMEFDIELQRGSNPLSVDILDMLNRPFSEKNISVIVK